MDVLVATRAVAIFLGEDRDPFELMTQYPAGKPAYSPRLNAPKIPIVNVPTTPTSAMNRAGTGLKNDDLDHRPRAVDPVHRGRLRPPAGRAAAPQQVNQYGGITVQAAPGMSEEQVAKKVRAELDARDRQAARGQRGRLGDNAD